VISARTVHASLEQFLWELIQNADDNRYAHGVEPTLTFFYRDDGYLWVANNERGFRKDDVTSLCHLTLSNKKNEEDTIGEKGIGFKSVFRVADIVWVSSGNFTFRFVRDKLLGTMTPEWANFKANGNKSFPKGETMFCFQIPKKGHQEVVKSGLAKLQAETMLFLRRLRCIRIMLGTIGDKELVESDTILRVERDQRKSSEERDYLTLIKSCQGCETEEQEDILLFWKEFENMPHEETREGTLTSQVALAFPLPRAGEDLPSRFAYNFLPIRNFGFKVRFPCHLSMQRTKHSI
jgi:hypothetical protein